jgi:4-oxalmesaconate hydratase
MIIDSHAHVVLGKADYEKMAKLAGSRNNPKMATKLPADEVSRPVAEGLVAKMDEVGTDVQFISPRPYLQMHSLSPRAVPLFWTRYCNDLIHQHCQMFPDRLKAVAGLPQYRDASPENCVEELERCVKELGFIGCILNPDPMEGDGVPPPGLGDPFWYPIYEKLVELDVPALIHSAGCCHPRESYTLKFINEGSVAVMSLLQSDVFKDFPTLKIVCSHGGGAIPYQFGRFAAGAIRGGGDFRDRLRNLYYDTVLYTQDAIELLVKTVGADRCLFGSECPGTGSVIDPKTDRPLDDVGSYIEAIEFLKPADKKLIFEDNARRLFGLKAQ